MRATWALPAFAWLGALLFAASLINFLYAYLVTFGRVVPSGPLWAGVSIDVGLFSVFALHHSVLARTGVKAQIAHVVPADFERPLYTWTASLLFLAVCIFWRLLPGELYHLEGPIALVGYAIQAIGFLLTLRAAAALGVLDLAGVRAAVDAREGHVPAHPPLKTSGLYGFVRHPLYFAWVLMVFGTPHMSLTRFVFAAVSTAYLALAIPFEERALVQVFGEDYRRYQRTVRWRMLPGLY